MITDGLKSGCVQDRRPVDSFSWESEKKEKVTPAHGCHCAFLLFVCLFVFPFYSYKLYFLYMYVREALMVKSILLNSFSFFKKKIMSFKCVNLYVERTFPLPVGDQTQTCRV